MYRSIVFMIMIRYSNNLYRALKYINATEILDCPNIANQPDKDNHIMEIVVWYLILSYYLTCLADEECDEKEAESIKETINTLCWMIPEKYFDTVMAIIENEGFNESGYMLRVALSDKNKLTIVAKKRNS